MLLVQEIGHFHINALINILLQNYFESCKCVQFIGGPDFKLSADVSMIVDKITSPMDVKVKLCDGFVVQDKDSLCVFEMIEWQIRHRKTYKYANRRYIFVVYNVEDLDSLASAKYLRSVFDVLVILHQKNKVILDLYTFHSSTAELVNQWCAKNKTFLSDRKLFPSRLKGHVFKVAAFNLPPYTILDTYHGIEFTILVEYCRRKNMSLEVVDFGEYGWGGLYENFTGYGVVGCLVDQECHAGIGGFYWQTIKPEYLDYVVPVVKIATNCLVPVPSLETSFLIAFLPFDKEIWLLIFAAVTGFIITWKASLVSVEGQTSIIEMIFTSARFILQQPTDLGEVLRAKAVLKGSVVLMFILMLLISIVYPSQLFKLTRNPMLSKAIYDIDDLQDSGISWGTIHYTYVEVLPEEKYKQLLKRLVVADEQQLLQLLLQGKFALVIEHLNTGYIVPKDINLINFMPMKTDLFWIWGTILMPINSIWQPSLQKHTTIISEIGLDEFWEQETFYEMGFGKSQRQLQSQEIFKLSPLSLWQIRGIFLVWGIGILISLAWFTVEVWIRNVDMTRNQAS